MLEKMPGAGDRVPPVPSRRPPRGVAIAPCSAAERPDVLTMLYRRWPASLRPGMVAEILRQADRGELDLGGLYAARRGGRLVGAMLTQTLLGRAVALWPPEVERGWRSGALAAAMVAAAVADARARGCRLVQALVDASAPRRAGADLDRGGLPYVTDLISMERPVADPLPIPPEAPRFGWEPFGMAVEPAFREVLERTYVGSLDMPELGVLRAFGDILEGHRAKPHFDPARWRLGRLPGEPGAAAVLLLSVGEGRAWEVSYLGLTPEARGRGLGRAALAHALELAAPHADRLDLSVDVRNLPAERLYRRSGFRTVERRGVHLAVLDG